MKDTGARNLPLHSFGANEIWPQIVALADDLIAWTQHLAPAGTAARCREPRTTRLRLFAVAARLITSDRQRILKLTRDWPWNHLLLTGQQRLAALNL